MAPPFKDLVPLMICRDVPASIRFYTEQLGFELVNREDSVGRNGFALLRNGPAQIYACQPQLHS